MQTLIIALLIIAVIFALLWKFAPSGWMTGIKAAMLTLWAQAGDIFESLTNVQWEGVMSQRNAIIVGAVLGVMVIVSRFRGHIKGTTEPAGGR